MDNDQRYVPVGNALPATLPPLTRKAAMTFAQHLTKRFGKLGLGSPNQLRPASLSSWRIFEGRRCWASPKPTAGTNHFKGWGRLIHDVSHLVFQARHPSFSPHAGGHATLEREMAEYVVAKGWLEVKPPKPTPDKKVARYESAQVRLKKWESRLKRCNTAIRKLRRAIARHERHLQH